jgi:tRNA 5-methylaminomethyl-2-thiouridine biosynthesis bifunctional protein
LHAQAGWIRPAALVQSWLRHENIRFHGTCEVRAVRRSGDHWELCDAQGKALLHADAVVFANAKGCAELVSGIAADTGVTDPVRRQLAALKCLYGTLSMGTADRDTLANGPHFPAIPCNGDGSFIQGLSMPQGVMWATGSTFEADASQLQNVKQQHRANFERLQHLLPDVATKLKPAFESDGLTHWSAARCISHDRFPLVGPLQNTGTPTLWMSAAMGSRGLSFSALSAELLAARMHAEPLPLPDRLARMLDVNRVLRSSTPVPVA